MDTKVAPSEGAEAVIDASVTTTVIEYELTEPPDGTVSTGFPLEAAEDAGGFSPGTNALSIPPRSAVAAELASAGIVVATVVEVSPDEGATDDLEFNPGTIALKRPPISSVATELAAAASDVGPELALAGA